MDAIEQLEMANAIAETTPRAAPPLVHRSSSRKMQQQQQAAAAPAAVRNRHTTLFASTLRSDFAMRLSKVVQSQLTVARSHSYVKTERSVDSARLEARIDVSTEEDATAA